MSTFAPIRNAFRAHGHKIALVDGARHWHFHELAAQVERIAAALRQALPAGSRVGLFMQNRAEYLILQLALERAGLVRVPLNMRYTAEEIGNLAADCGLQAVFCDGSTIDRTGLLPAQTWLCAVDGRAENGPAWTAVIGFEGRCPPPPEDYDTLCSINYTSGSSGVPKGVMLSYRNWHNVYRNMLVDRDVRGDDRLAHIGPLTHASGAYFMPFFLRGACNVIVPSGALDKLLPVIAEQRITAFSCVPTVLTRILSNPQIDRYDLSSIRWIGYGAEPIQRNTLHKALARWGDVLTHNYGLTEAMMTCCFLTAADHIAAGEHGEGEIRFGCIGRPYSFVDVVLRDPHGREVAPGEIGEITIRSEHMMQGYWNRPDETAKVLRDGWLWSGDLARIGPDGMIYIVGRSKEMLISGGFNIYPAEVEACLSNCPGVQETAVIGAPDADFGEICVAFVVAEAGAALNETGCEASCKQKIGIRTPKQWHFLPALPRTGNGKVDKAALRAQLHQQMVAS
jgi:acyl-CoA synthetase (AMP-forming)/AMP-acid ligase II